MERVYLDNNATTRPADEVVEAVTRAMREGWANPSSVHRAGQHARQQVDLARAEVCALLGCDETELVFTSGGTESVDLAVRGTLDARPAGAALVTTHLEHAAVDALAERLAADGVEVVRLPGDGRGVVDPDTLRAALRDRDDVGCVSIHWVNNETGVIQAIPEIGAICAEHGVALHTDATQCVGKLPVDLASTPIDLLSFSGHKLHGPQGVGGLFVRRGMPLASRLAGGPQERERRGGTENVAGIVGLGVAARLAREWLATDGIATQTRLRDGLERRVTDAVPGARVNGLGALRCWTTSSLAFDGLEAEPIILMLSERGVFVSAGAACSSGSVEPSRVVLAMGLGDARAEGSIRVSLARGTTAADVEAGVAALIDVCIRLGQLRTSTPSPMSRR